MNLDAPYKTVCKSLACLSEVSVKMIIEQFEVQQINSRFDQSRRSLDVKCTEFKLNMDKDKSESPGKQSFVRRRIHSYNEQLKASECEVNNAVQTPPPPSVCRRNKSYLKAVANDLYQSKSLVKKIAFNFESRIVLEKSAEKSRKPSTKNVLSNTCNGNVTAPSSSVNPSIDKTVPTQNGNYSKSVRNKDPTNQIYVPKRTGRKKLERIRESSFKCAGDDVFEDTGVVSENEIAHHSSILSGLNTISGSEMFLSTYTLAVGDQMKHSREANNLFDSDISDTRDDCIGDVLVNESIDDVMRKESQSSDSVELRHKNVPSNHERLCEMCEINNQNTCKVIDSDKYCDELLINCSESCVNNIISKSEDQSADKTKKIPDKIFKKHTSPNVKKRKIKTKSKESNNGNYSPELKYDPKSIVFSDGKSSNKSGDENSDSGLDDDYIIMNTAGIVEAYNCSIIMRRSQENLAEAVHVYEEVDAPNGSLDSNVKELNTTPKKFDTLSELIETEKTYVQSLSRIVNDYMPYIQEDDAPENVVEHSKYIFGNVQSIYVGHLHEMSGLLSCQKPGDVAKCFVENECILDLYPHYIRNKPKSDEIMNNYMEYKTFFMRKQNELHDFLDLSSYLLVPIQRLGKYRLLLQDLVHRCKDEEKELMEKAVAIVQNNLIKGNDYIAMDCITKCKVRIADQGQLLLRDQFRCITMNKKIRFEAMVFLFDKMILITEMDLKGSMQYYEYKDSIKITDLGITKMDFNHNVFKIWYQKHDRLNYTLYTKDSSTKKKWTDNISSRLWEQLEITRDQKKTDLVSQGIHPRIFPIKLKMNSTGTK